MRSVRFLFIAHARLIVYLKRPFAFLMNAVGFAPPICCLFFLSLRSFMMKFVVSIETLDEICL